MGLPRASKGHEAIERENTYKRMAYWAKKENKYYGYLDALERLDK